VRVNSRKPSNPFGAHLLASLAAERQGDIAILRLKWPHKRNALDDQTTIDIESFLTALPDGIVAVLHGAVVGGGLELAAAAHVRVAERIATNADWCACQQSARLNRRFGAT
jgi:(methylthio)acryloyl-CoA hydratase